MKKLLLLPILIALMTSCGEESISSSGSSGEQSSISVSFSSDPASTSGQSTTVSSSTPKSRVLSFLNDQQLRFDNNTKGAATIRFVCDGTSVHHAAPTSFSRNASYSFQIESDAPSLYFYFVKEDDDSVSYVVHPALLKEYYAEYCSDIIPDLRLTDCSRLYIAVSTEAGGWTHGLSSVMDDALEAKEG